MTSDTRLERELPDILAEMAIGSPDYLDDVFAQTARTRQRPAWTFPERWIPVSSLTTRLVAAPPLRWRTIAAIALLILALAAAIFVAGSRQSRLPAPFGPAVNGPIVYAWHGDIFTRASMASEARLIVGGPETDAIAGYSRDGTKVAFFRQVDGFDDLWIVGVDGSGPMRLAGPFDRVAAAAPWDVFDWSPSGDLIAVSHTSHDPALIEKVVIDLVRTDGRGATRLDVGMAAADPAWRPGEGHQLAFRGWGSTGAPAIFLWKPDGSDPVKLDLGHEGKQDGEQDFKNLAWAPAGDRLAYTTVDSDPGIIDDGWYRIHVATIGPDGEILNQRRLTSSADLEHEYHPAWLPAGDQLTFHRAPNGLNKVRVMVAPVDGGQARDLGLDGEEFVDCVSPDGKSILALEHASGVVSEVDLATGAVITGFPADPSTTVAAVRQRLAQ